MKSAASKITFELKQVHIKDMTLEGFDGDVSLQVNNPNWFGIKVADLDYHALISGKELASGKIDKEIDIPANGSAVAELPVTVSYGQLGNKFLNGLLSGGLNYRITGTAVFKTWFGERSVPFDTKERRLKGKGLKGLTEPDKKEAE
ncbi:MAG: LEA type 2 family protein [Nitrospirota bacterium]